MQHWKNNQGDPTPCAGRSHRERATRCAFLARGCSVGAHCQMNILGPGRRQHSHAPLVAVVVHGLCQDAELQGAGGDASDGHPGKCDHTTACMIMAWGPDPCQSHARCNLRPGPLGPSQHATIDAAGMHTTTTCFPQVEIHGKTKAH